MDIEEPQVVTSTLPSTNELADVDKAIEQYERQQDEMRAFNQNKKELLKRNQDLKLFLNSIDQKITFSDIRSCPLNKEHFFNLDGHPNSSGQDLLGKCAVNDEALIKFLKL